MKLVCTSLLLAGCAIASAAPPDAGADGGEPPPSLPPACNGMQYTHQLVRGRVRAAGEDGAHKHGRSYSIAWVEIDILEWLWGDPNEVDPHFRKSFYDTVAVSFCDAKHNCGFGGRGVATLLKERKGEELVFAVNLPRTRDVVEREDDDVAPIPERLIRRYGKKQSGVGGYCPVDAIPALVEIKKRSSRGARR
jgi:hypothetical protein